jgi:hypothetical protein
MSLSFEQIVSALAQAGNGRKPVFAPKLGGAFSSLIDTLASTPRKWGVAPAASLMKVFLPYLRFNTVFDNDRVVEEMGESPESFDNYAYPLLRFAKDNQFTYPHRPWPGQTEPVRKVA